MISLWILLAVLVSTSIGHRLEYSQEIETISNEEELIRELPGLDYKLNFKHYSGYLQVSPTHFLHYWY